MVRMSKLTDYGTVVMTYLARRPDAMHSAGEIAVDTHLALPTVSKVLKLLARDGLLVSSRGARGGYGLARPAQTISMAEIIRAMEGPIALTECSDEAGQCVQEPLCSIGGHWQRINQAMRETLEGIKLADMIEPLPARTSGVRVAQPPPSTETVLSREATDIEH
jgi:FeS assembly SUF system regulator